MAGSNIVADAALSAIATQQLLNESYEQQLAGFSEIDKGFDVSFTTHQLLDSFEINLSVDISNAIHGLEVWPYPLAE